jgi:teichuronic acid biosynthesis glycosyltransferase TuaC
MNEQPRLLVYSSLFPSAARPGAGLFIRERMFRVAARFPMVVVSPVPWFPLQGLIRRWKPWFRPATTRHEQQQGIDVYYPRFLSFPGVLKSLDGLFMALGSLSLLWRLRRTFRFNLIDAHFAFPDGDAATLLGRWFRVPVTITLRGTEVPLARYRLRRRRMLLAMQRATRIFAVADSLKRHVTALGTPEYKILVVGNGVDISKFYPLPQVDARGHLQLTENVPILISVGGLVERKGVHRVIEVLPALREEFPVLQYLVVGGPGPEGDWQARLKQQVIELGLQDAVRFLGSMPGEQLKLPLSAANVFVLATRNEGWANVFLEAMACGLPVVTTGVGGNAEVVCRPELGTIVPFGDSGALERALREALKKNWSREKILAYARDNAWEKRVDVLAQEFKQLVAENTDHYDTGDQSRQAVNDGCER